ncbi:MAG: hypothetical protein ACJZ41_01615 [Candidatus Pelagibacterales bacterium]
MNQFKTLMKKELNQI